jgi:DNA topoisomerase-3
MEAAQQETGVIAVVAEKPSVARDIARVLGAAKSGEGFLQGSGYVVTWAIGHLVALAQPHEIRPEWKRWRPDLLPMLPEAWPLVVNEKTKDQFDVVRKILNSPKVRRVVCATDAGREGELIFRYIYEAADCEKPFERLWISSLTPDAIRKGLASLRPGSEYNSLADAATGRSRADWLVGMNLSRAYSLALNEEISVGRVQTPTLAMVVERELVIRSFVPEEYVEVLVTFHPVGLPEDKKYVGVWFRAKSRDAAAAELNRRLPADGVEAKAIIERARTGNARIESIEPETQRTQPPPLFDLTELQRHANRLFGFSAQKTLDVAQALYERHKLISYPRTDSRFLSRDVAATLPQVVSAIKAPYVKDLAPGTGERLLSRRFVDDAKVSDHHAIIPTSVDAAKASLSSDERHIYDLICRRLLSAWHDDYVVAVRRIVTLIETKNIQDRYETTGTAVMQLGWKVLDLAPERKRLAKDEDAEPSLPAGLAVDQAQQVIDAKAAKKKTRPPKRFTEATLLTAMETAGKTLDEKELSDAMKESGLGTPATRAAIIEVLLTRDYIVRDGKMLEATDKGIHLIEVVHPEVKSPAMTGQWERNLRQIQDGAASLPPFMEGIENYVRAVVGKVNDQPTAPRALRASTSPAPVGEADAAAPQTRAQAPAPSPGTQLSELLHTHFGFSDYRPYQEDVCQAVMESKDVLLVMATGAGKSLCYQLPGIGRGGTTLVISPLIALMEDQVAKLKQRGFEVERIHSGRDRQQSRQVCLDYLAGKLQFLFIAPERLRVNGFPEMLAKHKPNLIAIDEAHCISQWGHDFRPDYRMLGQYLPTLRPAPVIALTATATVQVQHDIAQQLSLSNPARFIHGFRRDNIAIEVVEAAPSERTALALRILAEDGRRPAIIYVPTRKQCESVASELSYKHKAGAYHAGLDAKRRARVQEDFLESKTDVLVATTAFGMGIDKPDVRTVIHTALPGSLEGYYQEIGRAGRDGQPSRAILMHSYADRYTHDFFFERDYPDVRVLDEIQKHLTKDPVAKDTLRERLRMSHEIFDKALEKLWVHGGAMIDYAENVWLGDGKWRELYVAQGESKLAQIEQMIRYAQSPQCRMRTVVRHFGDLAGCKDDCGMCDACAPDDCVAQQFRDPTAKEQAAGEKALKALEPGQSKSTGKFHTELFPRDEMPRREFEELLGALARAGLMQFEDKVFEKDGKQIPYRLASLTSAGLAAAQAGDAEFLMKEDIGLASKRTRARRERKGKPIQTRSPKTVSPSEAGIEKALRAWRLVEAKKRGIPAFRIFTDQALQSMAEDRPASDDDLLSISGVGLATVRKYGTDILRIVGSVG